jgi:hypothetical protein
VSNREAGADIYVLTHRSNFPQHVEAMRLLRSREMKSAEIR